MARPKGWRNEPARHALAAKGIETGRFARHTERPLRHGRNQDPPIGSYFVNHWGNVIKFVRYKEEQPGNSAVLLFDEYSVPDEGYEYDQPGDQVLNPEPAGYATMKGLDPLERADGERLVELRNEVVNYRSDPIMFAYVSTHEELENEVKNLEVQLARGHQKTKEHALRVAEQLLDDLEKSDAPWTNVD